MRATWLTLTVALTACAASDSPSSSPPTQTIYVVRHAEAYKNLDPQPDMPPGELDRLTERGQAQARALGAWLADRGVSQVLSSPLGRTHETAVLIAAALPSPLEATDTPDLRPLAGGVDWAWREAAWSSGRDPRPEGGESLADGVTRALATLEGRDGALVLVTHGDVAAGLLGEAAGTALPQRFVRHAPPGGSVTELRRDGAGWTLGETWTPDVP